jgi:hypothetical protein
MDGVREFLRHLLLFAPGGMIDVVHLVALVLYCAAAWQLGDWAGDYHYRTTWFIVPNSEAYSKGSRIDIDGQVCRVLKKDGKALKIRFTGIASDAPGYQCGRRDIRKSP